MVYRNWECGNVWLHLKVIEVEKYTENKYMYWNFIIKLTKNIYGNWSKQFKKNCQIWSIGKKWSQKVFFVLTAAYVYFAVNKKYCMIHIYFHLNFSLTFHLHFYLRIWCHIKNVQNHNIWILEDYIIDLSL